MELKYLTIRHLRGIRQLDWAVGGRFVCLVGPGDSTKTTILEAIEYALAPRWTLPLVDSDFHEGDTSQAIEIVVTVGDLPDELIAEDRFGLELRGWHPTDGIRDEPDDECEPVLTIRVRVDDSLEPQWTVINDRNPDGKMISWRDRQKLGVARLGSEADVHFGWGRGSALYRMTTDPGSAGDAVATAYRAARDAVGGQHMEALEDAARRAENAIKTMGVAVANGCKPTLDARLASVGVGMLTLSDGTVPLRSWGLGSRRLAAVAVERLSIPNGAIILIDEVELGLEPHRIRQFLRRMRHVTSKSQAQTDQEDAPRHGQFIITTHSPVVVEEAACRELRVVRSSAGTTTLHTPSDEVQGTVRAVPQAILGRSIILCEGQTEIGLLRGIEPWWIGRHDGLPVSYFGVALATGGGRTEGPRRARHLAQLGFRIAYLGDADQPLDPPEIELTNDGVRVVLWSDNLTTEQRVCQDVPFETLNQVVSLAIQEHKRPSVLSSMQSALNADVPLPSHDISDWIEAGHSEADVRAAIGVAAKKSGWFKRIDLGQQLGELISAALDSIPESDLANKLLALEQWAYGE